MEKAIHPSELDLQALRADVLPPEQQAPVRAHLADCPHCQQLLAQYERLDVVLQAAAVRARAQALSPSFETTLLNAALEAQKQQLALQASLPDRIQSVVVSLFLMSAAGGLVLWPRLTGGLPDGEALAQSLRFIAVFQRGIEVLLLVARDVGEHLFIPTLLLLLGTIVGTSLLLRRRLRLPLLISGLSG